MAHLDGSCLALPGTEGVPGVPAPPGPALKLGPPREPGPAGSRGLYRPDMEHDSCGVAFVADLHGRPSHEMVELGLASLYHLEHRG
ncbi:MAG: hypothetical protein ACRDZX_06500, partial [Acidimicrobiales bacterium]